MADDGPLRGSTILLTRPAHQVRGTIERLSAHGATVLAIPLIAIVPPADSVALDDALRRLSSYHWLILTSANAVRQVDQRLRALALEWSSSVRVAAIGSATARALESCGRAADLVPERFVAEGLLEALPTDLRGQRILFPRAEEARELLPDELRRRGAELELVTAYRTAVNQGARDELLAALATRPIDSVVFTSASTVDAFFALLGEQAPPACLRFACIGPITARALAAHGARAAVVPDEHTIDGLVEALLADPIRR